MILKPFETARLNIYMKIYTHDEFENTHCNKQGRPLLGFMKALVLESISGL